MIENLRKSGKWTTKNWVAAILFGAIIFVFALWGVDPSRYGTSATGGVAAVVNDTTISISEFRNRVESIEQNARMRFDQFPEAQRKALTQELRKRALEELILTEVVYQAAHKKGVVASDGEVRDYILQIPFLQENGRFQRDRYRAFLQNMNMSTEDFERQIRKQIVNQKLQELFVGSAAPTREELRRNRELANQKVSLRFVEFNRATLDKGVKTADVDKYLAANMAEVEKYYKDNAVEYSKPERVTARHILVRIDDKRPEAEAKKQIEALRKEATPQNFAKLASKSSDDPGSKANGGSLGEFERGRMVPAFEQVAFEMKPGQISDPIKTDFGYHIIYVEKKSPAETQPLDSVKQDIARKLYSRSKESELLADVRKVVESGDKKQIAALVNQYGLKWQDTGEFDLSSSTIPKFGDSTELVGAVLKQGKAGGVIPRVIDTQGRHVLAEVTSWKQTPDTATEVEGLERMVAFRKSADLIETWSKEVEAKATVQRNPRVMQ